MAVLTGADGQLLYGKTVIAKIRDFSITVNKEALETTCLASYDRSYVEGLRGSTASATLLYDPENSTANKMLNSILQTEGVEEELTFKMNRKNAPNGGGNFTLTGFITSISPSVSVGAVQAVSITFQVSGKPQGVF